MLALMMSHGTMAVTIYPKRSANHHTGACMIVTLKSAFRLKTRTVASIYPMMSVAHHTGVTMTVM